MYEISKRNLKLEDIYWEEEIDYNKFNKHFPEAKYSYELKTFKHNDGVIKRLIGKNESVICTKLFDKYVEDWCLLQKNFNRQSLYTMICYLKKEVNK